jgi:hypothetical protein
LYSSLFLWALINHSEQKVVELETNDLRAAGKS